MNCTAVPAARLRRARQAAVSVFAFLFAATVAAAPSPDETAQELAARKDQIIAKLRTLKQQDELSPENSLTLIREELSPIIDFRRLAGQATGKYWRRAKDDEKTRIVDAFRALLENTYAKVLSQYSDQKVAVVESKMRGDGTVLVGVEVQGDGKTALIEYVFYEKDGAMRITDVLVERVSLLNTYRRQFAQIAKKEGTAGLATRLEELAKR